MTEFTEAFGGATHAARKLSTALSRRVAGTPWVREIRISQEREIRWERNGSGPAVPADPSLQPPIGPVKIVVEPGVVGGELWLTSEEEGRLFELLELRHRR